jgi:branched-chain amino acid aminotransferase
MNQLVNINGKLTESNLPVLLADNHSYRYADGLFETIKVINGEIKLEQYHFDRLDKGLRELKFKKPVFFTTEKIKEEIIHLCRKNKCEDLARVRLSVSRGNGGVNDCDDKFQYMIECWPLEESINKWNENGLIIDIFPDARKSIDKFSNLKTANYLPFVLAAIWAKENKLNDALLLNSKERICEATIANVFWVKD